MSDLQRLIEGYRRFRDSNWAQERERWAEMAEGQNPRVMILSCADSRVDPAHIFDARPGEMFVVRNIAALAPPYETSPGFHGVSLMHSGYAGQSVRSRAPATRIGY